MGSMFSVLGAVTGLYMLFLLALLVTSRHDRTMHRTFASPPTHVRVLHDDPSDAMRTAEPQPTAPLLGREAA